MDLIETVSKRFTTSQNEAWLEIPTMKKVFIINTVFFRLYDKATSEPSSVSPKALYLQLLSNRSQINTLLFYLRRKIFMTYCRHNSTEVQKVIAYRPT